MRWTVYRIPVSCGAVDGCTVPAGEPVAVLAGKLRRCAAHAGAPVNEQEVDLERFRVERDVERAAIQREHLPPAPARRIVPHRRPRAFSAVQSAGLPFDGKAAGASDE